jgi:hypothetical protein
MLMEIYKRLPGAGGLRLGGKWYTAKGIRFV